MRTNGLRHASRLGLLMLVTLIGGFAFGQTANTGEIKGTVTDPSGATVAGVKVTITNVQTGVSTATETNAAGIYDVPSVPTGEYRITFAKAGFRDFVRQGVTLQLQTVAIDAQLQVGAAMEQVVVTAEVPLLQTETSDQTTHFDTKAILDAPIVGGVWYSELTKTLPGVSAQAGEGVAVNGMQNYSATYSMEGTNVTDPRDVNVSDNYPPIDAIQEVDVNSANGGAQNGYSPLTLNLNLKSGTNTWHGSLFEFNQNDFFESRNYFQRSGKKAPQRWNEFGGSFGGPIVKNKAFFFFTYQRNPVKSGGFFTTTVPTMAMRTGDFTATDLVTGNPLFSTVYDSTSCSMPCARTPLNGGSNMISSGQIDPVAAAILSYIPNPTDTNNTHLINNFSTVVSTPSLGEWYVGKIDYNFSSSHRLSGSIFNYPQSLTFNADALCGLGFDCTRTQPNNPNRSARITETWTVSPTVVNEFRVGAMREHDQYAGDTFGKGFLTKLGIQPAYGSNAPVDVFPNITVDGTSGIGVTNNSFIGGGIHANLVEDMYNASDVVTLIRGKHTVKLGGELDRLFQHDTTWGDASSGNFEFNGVGTKSGTASDPRAGGNTSPGVPFADFLLGDTYGWFIFNGEPTNVASWLTAAFVNDDFKVTPRLTLNLGLRYQHQTGYAVADGRFANFDPKLVNPASYLPPNSLGAMRYGSIDGRSNNTIEPSVNSWAPRIGFAWSPRNKWSLRASYGLFQLFRNSETYARDNYPANLGFGFSPQGSFGYSSNNPAFALSVGPPPNSVFVPTASNLTADAFNFKVVANYPAKIPLMYDQQFLLSVQRELPANHVVDVSYVHTKGSNLQFPTDINQIPQSQLLDPNPSGTGPFGTDRPVPWFQSILSHEFTGYSNYNALQFRVQKRTSHGVSYQFNYAWSKLLDTGSGGGHASEISTWQIAGNPRANYGLSDIDAAHVLTGTITYELPFGPGRMFPVHGVMNQIVGGWRLSSVITARSGSPFTVFMNQPFDTEGSGQCFCGFGLRPDRTGSGKLSNPTINQWFDLSAFTVPAFVTVNGTNHFTFGDSGRNILRGPRQVDTDLSLGKNFKVTERVGLEFRADSYNVFNHPQFNNPSSGISFAQNGSGQWVGSGAGQITSANGFGPGRIIQLGGRVSF
jgi:hypothetical protein